MRLVGVVFRSALVSLFEMCWEGALSQLTPGDRAEYERLSQQHSQARAMICVSTYSREWRPL